MTFRAPFLWVVIAGVLVSTPLSAEKHIFVPANDVSFKISTVSQIWGTDESVTLSYRVKNVSNARLFVPREWEASCPAKPHLWAWFENSSGKHFVPGFAGSCMGGPKSFSERMSKEAVLLEPGEHLDGTFLLDPKLFRLKPGIYRIEASLTGWSEEEFTDVERSELAHMASPFMRGEVHASIRITLQPNPK